MRTTRIAWKHNLHFREFTSYLPAATCLPQGGLLLIAQPKQLRDVSLLGLTIVYTLVDHLPTHGIDQSTQTSLPPFLTISLPFVYLQSTVSICSYYTLPLICSLFLAKTSPIVDCLHTLTQRSSFNFVQFIFL